MFTNLETLKNNLFRGTMPLKHGRSWERGLFSASPIFKAKSLGDEVVLRTRLHVFVRLRSRSHCNQGGALVFDSRINYSSRKNPYGIPCGLRTRVGPGHQCPDIHCSYCKPCLGSYFYLHFALENNVSVPIN